MSESFQSRLTFDACLVWREDSSVSTRRCADVQVKLNIVLEPVAMFLTLGEDGLLMLLFAVTIQGLKQLLNSIPLKCYFQDGIINHVKEELL